LHREIRQTGVGGREQGWPYCMSCWRACQSDAVDEFLALALLCTVFRRGPRGFRLGVGPVEE
jgi:hypothetical protein